MPRMYVEGEVLNGASRRDAAAYLTRELDQKAEAEGHRVIGDLTILEGEAGALTTIMRVEADVEPVA